MSDIAIDPLSSARILIASSDINARDHIVSILKPHYPLLIAEDGETALSCIHEYEPALLLADASMPGLSGTELLKRVRANPDTCTLPFMLLFSAEDNEQLHQEGLNAGVICLTHPVPAAELLSRVSTQLTLWDMQNKGLERERLLRLEAETLSRQLEQELAERLRMEEALKEANRRKDEFLRNMSHEIRTPMNAVVGLAHVLNASQPLTDRQREVISTLQMSAESLLSMLNDLLDIRHMETGMMTLERVAFSLSSILGEVLALFESEAAQKNLYLQCHLPPDERHFLGDPQRLRQVVTNLVDNAIKFTSQGGVTMTLSFTPAEPPHHAHACIGIKDTGVGVDADMHRAIFEKFTQGDMSTTRPYGGSGLGLTISHNLMQLMGGSIEVESADGQGAHFRVHLPLHYAQNDNNVSASSLSGHGASG